MTVSEASNIATIPLFYELAATISHPCSYTILGAFLATANNFITTLSSFCFFFAGIGNGFICRKQINLHNHFSILLLSSSVLCSECVKQTPLILNLCLQLNNCAIQLMWSSFYWILIGYQDSLMMQ